MSLLRSILGSRGVRTVVMAGALALCAGLAGCGQKGPLYLPGPAGAASAPR